MSLFDKGSVAVAVIAAVALMTAIATVAKTTRRRE